MPTCIYDYGNNLSKDGGLAFNEAHDFALIVHPVYYRDQCIQYSASDLASIENRLIQLPKIIDDVELQQARLSLDDTENMLNSIVQHRRIKTTTETIMKYLSYLGYASLGLVTMYISYSFGLFELLKNCIPKRICLFCVKTKIDTSTHVITYNASVQPLLTEPPKNRRIKI